jgi:hypothetical protein
MLYRMRLSFPCLPGNTLFEMGILCSICLISVCNIFLEYSPGIKQGLPVLLCVRKDMIDNVKLLIDGVTLVISNVLWSYL